jgi:DNA modification methylase
MEQTLFDPPAEPKPERLRTSFVPTSVIDIGKQEQRRSEGGHDNVSSRAEHSHFPDEAGDVACELFLRGCSLVFDPFAGWGERHNACRKHGLNYVGYDINPEAIEYARKTYSVENTLANSMHDAVPAFDGLFTCPPYWNLEWYSDRGIENHKTFPEFVDSLRQIFCHAFYAAKPGARFVVVVGDWRAKHVYYDLAFHVHKIFTDLGARPVDEVILSRKTISKIKIMIPQALRLGYTVKVHEKMLVFKKAFG